MQSLTTVVLRLLATMALLLTDRALAADADPLTEAADRVAIQNSSSSTPTSTMRSISKAMSVSLPRMPCLPFPATS